jgi:hypothetical protein
MPAPPTCTVPAAGAQPLRITLPGGLVVAGVPVQIGATSLQQSLALVAAAGPAMAPLGPIFSIIDAVLAVKDFAQAVPELIVNPGALLEAIAKLITKIGKLLSLVPQLSVPIMVLGVVDAILALLAGLLVELSAILAQEARIASAITTANGLQATNPTAAAALLHMTDCATASVAVQRQDLQTALLGVDPLLGIVNAFVGLLGLPALSIELDMGGSTAGAVEALNAAVVVLQTFRRSIPV